MKIEYICGIFCLVDDNDSRKLDTILSLAKENNAMLHKIRSAQKTAQMFRAIYWVFILATVLGAFYFVKPYLDNLLSVYSAIGGVGTKEGIKIPDAQHIQELIDQLK